MRCVHNLVTADAVADAKTPCAAADTEPKFILHVVPVRLRDLSPPRASTTAISGSPVRARLLTGAA